MQLNTQNHQFHKCPQTRRNLANSKSPSSQGTEIPVGQVARPEPSQSYFQAAQSNDVVLQTPESVQNASYVYSLHNPNAIQDMQMKMAYYHKRVRANSKLMLVEMMSGAPRSKIAEIQATLKHFVLGVETLSAQINNEYRYFNSLAHLAFQTTAISHYKYAGIATPSSNNVQFEASQSCAVVSGPQALQMYSADKIEHLQLNFAYYQKKLDFNIKWLMSECENGVNCSKIIEIQNNIKDFTSCLATLKGQLDYEKSCMQYYASLSSKIVPYPSSLSAAAQTTITQAQSPSDPPENKATGETKATQEEVYVKNLVVEKKEALNTWASIIEKNNAAFRHPKRPLLKSSQDHSKFNSPPQRLKEKLKQNVQIEIEEEEQKKDNVIIEDETVPSSSQSAATSSTSLAHPSASHAHEPAMENGAKMKAVVVDENNYILFPAAKNKTVLLEHLKEIEDHLIKDENRKFKLNDAVALLGRCGKFKATLTPVILKALIRAFQATTAVLDNDSFVTACKGLQSIFENAIEEGENLFSALLVKINQSQSTNFNVGQLEVALRSVVNFKGDVDLINAFFWTLTKKIGNSKGKFEAENVQPIIEKIKSHPFQSEKKDSLIDELEKKLQINSQKDIQTQQEIPQSEQEVPIPQQETETQNLPIADEGFFQICLGEFFTFAKKANTLAAHSHERAKLIAVGLPMLQKAMIKNLQDKLSKEQLKCTITFFDYLVQKFSALISSGKRIPLHGKLYEALVEGMRNKAKSFRFID